MLVSGRVYFWGCLSPGSQCVKNRFIFMKRTLLTFTSIASCWSKLVSNLTFYIGLNILLIVQCSPCFCTFGATFTLCWWVEPPSFTWHSDRKSTVTVSDSYFLDFRSPRAKPFQGISEDADAAKEAVGVIAVSLQVGNMLWGYPYFWKHPYMIYFRKSSKWRAAALGTVFLVLGKFKGTFIL